MRNYIILVLLSLTVYCYAQHGIEYRESNTSILINNLPSDDPGSMKVQRVFPELNFSRPVYICEAPGDLQKIFVVQKNGIIYSFPKNNANSWNVSKFLDISNKVRTSSEQGLLGLAFDPDYADNGKFYIYYSWSGTNPGTTRISRFTNNNPNADFVDLATEEILLEVRQPYSNHNGGMIEIGPDGMLYIGLGDGGFADDPHGHGQNTTTLLGNILRIDVTSPPDPGLAYKIPRDNPFYSGGPNGSSTRKEIYAYGLRNPWRFSFDRLHGHLYVGDVGQNALEEIDIVESGGNYGWKIMEGKSCFKSSNCNKKGLIAPILDYRRSDGFSITGGYVYHAQQVPELFGMYIYGDYGSGKIWGLRYDGSNVTANHVLVSNSGLNIASFGQGADGEVYIVDYNGGIYALRPAQRNPEGFPLHLSDIPALLKAGKGIDQTNLGIIPYDPSAKLWSDGLLKSRFLALPYTETIGFKTVDGWDFPENSVLIKNFALPISETNPTIVKHIETRLLYRKNNQWHGFSYEWNEDDSDAVLLTSSKQKVFSMKDKNGKTVEVNHLFPSRAQCIQCHTNASNGVLGLTTAQLNSTFLYPKSKIKDNQLRTFEHIHMFSSSLPKDPGNLPVMPDPMDKSASIQDRARAYLATNCAMCHRPGGTAPTDLDFRWETTNSLMKAINVRPGNGDLGIPDARIVFPGNPQKSVLLQRMLSRSDIQMPPIATSRVDNEATALIREWIMQLNNR